MPPRTRRSVTAAATAAATTAAAEQGSDASSAPAAPATPSTTVVELLSDPAWMSDSEFGGGHAFHAEKGFSILASPQRAPTGRVLRPRRANPPTEVISLLTPRTSLPPRHQQPPPGPPPPSTALPMAEASHLGSGSDGDDDEFEDVDVISPAAAPAEPTLSQHLRGIFDGAHLDDLAAVLGHVSAPDPPVEARPEDGPATPVAPGPAAPRHVAMPFSLPGLLTPVRPQAGLDPAAAVTPLVSQPSDESQSQLFSPTPGGNILFQGSSQTEITHPTCADEGAQHVRLVGALVFLTRGILRTRAAGALQTRMAHRLYLLCRAQLGLSLPVVATRLGALSDVEALSMELPWRRASHSGVPEAPGIASQVGPLLFVFHRLMESLQACASWKTWSCPACALDPNPANKLLGTPVPGSPAASHDAALLAADLGWHWPAPGASECCRSRSGQSAPPPGVHRLFEADPDAAFLRALLFASLVVSLPGVRARTVLALPGLEDDAPLPQAGFSFPSSVWTPSGALHAEPPSNQPDPQASAGLAAALARGVPTVWVEMWCPDTHVWILADVDRGVAGLTERSMLIPPDPSSPARSPTKRPRGSKSPSLKPVDAPTRPVVWLAFEATSSGAVRLLDLTHLCRQTAEQLYHTFETDGTPMPGEGDARRAWFGAPVRPHDPADILRLPLPPWYVVAERALAEGEPVSADRPYPPFVVTPARAAAICHRLPGFYTAFSQRVSPTLPAWVEIDHARAFSSNQPTAAPCRGPCGTLAAIGPVPIEQDESDLRRHTFSGLALTAGHLVAGVPAARGLLAAMTVVDRRLVLDDLARALEAEAARRHPLSALDSLLADLARGGLSCGGPLISRLDVHGPDALDLALPPGFVLRLLRRTSLHPPPTTVSKLRNHPHYSVRYQMRKYEELCPGARPVGRVELRLSGQAVELALSGRAGPSDAATTDALTAAFPDGAHSPGSPSSSRSAKSRLFDSVSLPKAAASSSKGSAPVRRPSAKSPPSQPSRPRRKRAATRSLRELDSEESEEDDGQSRSPERPPSRTISASPASGSQLGLPFFQTSPSSSPASITQAGKTTTVLLDVYRRSDVVLLNTRAGWHKQGRQVRPGERSYKLVRAVGAGSPDRPAAETPPRRRPRLGDPASPSDVGPLGLHNPDPLIPGMVALFGEWQTEPFSLPRVATTEEGKLIVPRNAFGNVDLFRPCMLPIGCLWIRDVSAARIARDMEVDFVEAVVDFSFRGRTSFPVTRGIIVAESHAERLIDAIIQSRARRAQREQARTATQSTRQWGEFLQRVVQLHRRVRLLGLGPEFYTLNPIVIGMRYSHVQPDLSLTAAALAGGRAALAEHAGNPAAVWDQEEDAPLGGGAAEDDWGLF
ncbi:hypothetical protein H696_01187 [Fonticula alba]|uniref:Rad4 beta-hairpin domain-containing protein n=1 Tax=Fonticula alba TaxID=691883 RepID=A0A058ZBJ2_FONAL|nr:hypothetical protein H696_01187 [Fonticula alba]KCV71769.1 hypothetical protein H696_01187 [Fonticula alba]|eukprot:XP_009493347.1 hypothetical protein H696_01187 [Fonticula alba]